jgi:hypothetical protein
VIRGRRARKRALASGADDVVPRAAAAGTVVARVAAAWALVACAVAAWAAVACAAVAWPALALALAGSDPSAAEVETSVTRAERAAAGRAPPAAGSEEPVAPGPDALPSNLEIREPLYELLVAIARDDSLGVWDAPALKTYVCASGRPSRLPLDHLVSVERRAAAPPEDEPRGGARVGRIWRVTLDRDLDLPMPYSILGYHPGTLRIARRLVFSEWRLGDVNLRIANGDSNAVLQVAGLFVFRLDAGWLILDADALVDRMLGGMLDDTWTDGLAFGRCDGVLIGLGLGRSRRLRPIYGEFDFRADKVRAHGRPLASRLSSFARQWTTPPAGAPSRAWVDHD